MASMNDQMRMDSSWTRTHPATDTTLATRTHGQHYLYNYAPNFNERIEMSMRSLGRQYNWEMEKYRNDKKPADRGNKRRFIKNLFRFFKNPYGFIHWKTKRWYTGGRVLLTFFYISFPILFYQGWKRANQEQKETQFFVKLGDKINGPRGLRVGNYDQIYPFKYNFATNLGLTRLESTHYVANPTYRMNYRKHRETLRRNNDEILKYFKASNMKEAHARNFGFS